MGSKFAGRALVIVSDKRIPKVPQLHVSIAMCTLRMNSVSRGLSRWSKSCSKAISGVCFGSLIIPSVRIFGIATVSRHIYDRADRHNDEW